MYGHTCKPYEYKTRKWHTTVDVLLATGDEEVSNKVNHSPCWNSTCTTEGTKE